MRLMLRSAAARAYWSMG